jgi:hypothetical protein
MLLLFVTFHGFDNFPVVRVLSHAGSNAAAPLVRLKHMYKEYMPKMLLEGKRGRGKRSRCSEREI